MSHMLQRIPKHFQRFGCVGGGWTQHECDMSLDAFVIVDTGPKTSDR